MEDIHEQLGKLKIPFFYLFFNLEMCESKTQKTQHFLTKKKHY